jgi:anti-repressor protein
MKKRLRGEGVVSSEGVSITTNQHGKTSQQVNTLLFINEPNLYRCIFQSRKKEAEQFQDWVFEEVLPAIRAKGTFSLEEREKLQTELSRTDKLLSEYQARVLELAENIKKAKEIVLRHKENAEDWRDKYQLADMGRKALVKRNELEVKALEKQFKERAKTYAENIAKLEEKLALYEQQKAEESMRAPEHSEHDYAVYGRACVKAERSCTIATLAKLLRSNGVDTGPKRLGKWLREEGYLCKCGVDRGFPVQKAVEKGWFEVKMVEAEDYRGQKILEITPLVTTIGQQHIINKFLGGQAL